MDFLLRKQDVQWTSPSGKVFVLKTKEGGYKRKHVGEVKTTPVDKKKNNNTKKIIDSADTFADKGVGGKDVSLQAMFIGDNHDLEANEFEEALCEVGKSRLRLAYGNEFTVNVIDFDVSYGLVEKINATFVSVNFHQTSDTLYPKSQTSENKNINNKAALTNEIAASNLSEVIENVSEQSLLDSLNTSFSNILERTASALDTINDATLTSIITDVAGQTFTNNSFTIISQLQKILNKAATSVHKVKNFPESLTSGTFHSLFRSFDALVTSLITHGSSNSTSLTKSQSLNLQLTDTILTSAISSIASAAVEYDFQTRKEATEAAGLLLDLENKRNDFIEDEESKITNLEEKNICDTGLSDLVGSAASAIIEKSFSLKIEKTIHLSDGDSIVNLAYKYYKENFEKAPEETIAFLINSNGFEDDNFFYLEKGTDLKIYV